MAAPRISIVLVVYREQAYLRDCLQSVLEQPFREVEVVAVDDASPDHGPEILDELADADARLVLHRFEASVSLGEARRAGLTRATGDYVWFAGTTDRLPARALGAVVKRLHDAQPDVLVVDHTRETPPHDQKPGPYHDVLAAAPPGAFPVADYPPALELGGEIRDKILSRAFLEAGGWPFGPGRHGHLTVTYPALLAAERVAVLPQVAYARYDPPNAAGEPFVHGLEVDVFDEYEALFRALGSEPPEVVAGMARHYAALLPRVSPELRDDFRARAAASLRRHGASELPDSERHPGRQRRRRLSRRALGKTAAKILRRDGGRSHYRRELREPIDSNLAAFAAYWYRGYACNPRAIYETLGELAPWIRGVWVVGRDHEQTMPAGVEYVVAGTREYYSLLARAKYFVNNVNFPNEVVKREGTIHVQTHHGTPLKTMGLDLRNAQVAGSRMNFERLLERCARWDYNVSSNPFSTLVWERVYPMRYETLEVGYPRNDVLVNADEADIERIRSELGIGSDQRLVLYAPTHREYVERYEPTVDVTALAQELGPEYVIGARAHYFYARDSHAPDSRRSGGAGVLDVSSHPSVEELCLAADVLLTDYSSVMFDYAVLDRPIVVHAPDWEEYRSRRGTYFDLLAEPPGVVTRTHEELVAALRTDAAWGEEAARLRSAFREHFCALEDGRAAERVIKAVWLGEHEEPSVARRPPPRAKSRVEA